MVPNNNLQKVVARHEELGELMLAPDVASSGNFVDMSKEYAELTPVVEAITNLNSAQAEAADLATILADLRASVTQHLVFLSVSLYCRVKQGLFSDSVHQAYMSTFDKLGPEPKYFTLTQRFPFAPISR